MAIPKRGLLGQYAGFVSRSAALIVDLVLITLFVIFINWLVALPITFFTNVDIAPCVANPSSYSTLVGLTCRALGITWLTVSVLASPLYFTVLFATTGQTIGMYLLGIRVVRTNGGPMNIWRGFLRWIGYFASAIPVGAGFFWIFFNDQRRGFHDIMADTVVVYSWHARYNEFYVARVRRWLHSGESETRTVTLDDQHSLVTVAVPDRTRMRAVLNIMERTAAVGELDVLYTAVYVTDHVGKPQLFGVTDLDSTTDDLHLYDVHYDIPAGQLAKIQADMEPESFVICSLLNDQYADQLVTLISKRMPALIRTYSMGTKAQMQSQQVIRAADAGLLPLEGSDIAQAPATSARPAPSTLSSSQASSDNGLDSQTS